MKKVSIRFPEDLYKKIKSESLRTKRSFNGQILWLVENMNSYPQEKSA